MLGENALGAIDLETVVAKPEEELPQMLDVLVDGGTGHQYIIQVDEGGVHVRQQLVHASLERLCRVTKAKWHE